MGEVLGLDTVVAVNLGSVEQAAKTESVQCHREDVPELRYWLEMLSGDQSAVLPVVSPDTVEGEHGQGDPGHCCLYEEPAGDVEVPGLVDGEEAAQQGPHGGGQAQPELQQGEVLSHHSLSFLPLVVHLRSKH